MSTSSPPTTEIAILASQHEAGIQISLRLPRAALAKLSRLASASVQTKSQFITKLLSRLPEEYLLGGQSNEQIPGEVVEKALR
jgi:hypothetical protein